MPAELAHGEKEKEELNLLLLVPVWDVLQLIAAAPAIAPHVLLSADS